MVQAVKEKSTLYIYVNDECMYAFIYISSAMNNNLQNMLCMLEIDHVRMTFSLKLYCMFSTVLNFSLETINSI